MLLIHEVVSFSLFKVIFAELLFLFLIVVIAENIIYRALWMAMVVAREQAICVLDYFKFV